MSTPFPGIYKPSAQAFTDCRLTDQILQEPTDNDSPLDWSTLFSHIATISTFLSPTFPKADASRTCPPTTQNKVLQSTDSSSYARSNDSPVTKPCVLSRWCTRLMCQLCDPSHLAILQQGHATTYYGLCVCCLWTSLYLPTQTMTKVHVCLGRFRDWRWTFVL
ncbi:hypothetical protein P154DRAFT_525766 [Amniculicola lignicola CBS 123094]|uniref:Uncharacterized protein n=1 Tax=Amniculicola lignicola CBS 123094 TaxID=1392246 RepID=A0A6A5W7W7_9PLEO|nr:hypothetical protein P154DRAFT_525766 [Amniculicola lignicola CBS 123094]